MEQNLNLYQVFYEVANCRNFSIAAKKMYISQPAISKAISKLEENLNTSLFLRSSRGVSLTREGELLYRYVEQALNTLKSGEEQLQISSSQKISHLSIGVSTMLCKYVLLPVLKEFMEENPNIKISISCQSTYDTLTLLQEGSIDIGLVGLPHLTAPEKNTAITYLPLRKIEDIFVATDSYLASFQSDHREKTMEKRDFLSEAMEKASFIMLNSENISRKYVDSFLTEHQITFQNVIEVNNMDLAIEFARAGLGIACVIRDFVEQDMAKGILREIKLGHRIPKRQIGFACKTADSALHDPSLCTAKSALPKAADALIDYCRHFMNI